MVTRTPLMRFARPSLKNKLLRLLWQVSYHLLFRYTPTPLHGWRRSVLRLFGAKIGLGVVIYPSANIWAPWNLEVEDYATIGWNCELYNVAIIQIGREVIVSQSAYLCTATHDFQSEFQLMAAPIDIGARAWVAADAFVGPGVWVGEGAVIGARCVATQSVDAWSVVAGNPARLVGTRSSTARNDLHSK